MQLKVTEFKSYQQQKVVDTKCYELKKEHIDKIEKSGFNDMFILSYFKGEMDPWSSTVKYQLIMDDKNNS